MATPTTTIETVTDQQIKALRREAAEASDPGMVALCDQALGNGRHRRTSRARCVDVIRDAEARR